MPVTKKLILLILFAMVNECLLNGQDDAYTQSIPGTKISIELTKIPAGKIHLSDQSSVKLIEMNAFWMSTFEITDDQYQVFRDKKLDSNESELNEEYDVDAITRPTPPYLDFTYGMGNTGGFPAVSMTQQAALRYCKWLYDKTGIFFRLPTELEWQYACLGGEKIEDLAIEDYAWNWGNSGEKYHKVGSKKANGYGLYDMLGNVAEYTSDQYIEALMKSLTHKEEYKALVLPSGKYGRVVKGGAYDDEEESCTCEYRIPSNAAWQARDPQIPKSIWWNPDSPFVGFRIVRPEGEYTREEVETYFRRMIVD
jgi:formylglycine-generating enzyme required for sulfatase activity